MYAFTVFSYYLFWISFFCAILLGVVYIILRIVYACGNEPKQFGDFKYEVKGVGKNIAYLQSFTETGMKKEVIILPPQVGGYILEINNVGNKYRLSNDPVCNLASDNLKKIILNGNIEINTATSLFARCPKLEKIIYNGVSVRFIDTDMWKFDKVPVFIARAYYMDSTGDYSYDSEKILPANVTYLYNYEGVQNGLYVGDGIYFIDDYDNETIGYKPPNPEREGYYFFGWYKEPECINEWNFETDIVPKRASAKDVSRDEYFAYFKEVKLYAKWTERP